MNSRAGFVASALLGLVVVLLQGASSIAYAQTSDGLTENTKPPLQIVNQTGLKVVVQVNYADTIPNGINKQVLAAENLYASVCCPWHEIR